MRRLAVIVCVGFLSIGMAACASEEGGKPVNTTPTVEPLSPAKASIAAATPATTPLPTPSSRSIVIWADYSVGLQTDIDTATAAKDCRGIQTFFGMTTATEESMKASKGHGNSSITSYLEEALALANCR